MRLEDLKDLYSARPFQPFFVRTTDGRELLVKHPEFMAFTPSGRTVFIAEPTLGMNIIDVMLINSVFVKERGGTNGRNGHAKKRRKR